MFYYLFIKCCITFSILTRQTANDLTGEHSCVMLKVLENIQLADRDGILPPVNHRAWLEAFWSDFRRRFVSLLGFQFRKMSPALALAVLHNKAVKETHTGIYLNLILNEKHELKLIFFEIIAAISRRELELQLNGYDLKRLEYYARNMADYHLIVDLLPTVTKIYCLGQMGDTHFSAVQLVKYVLTKQIRNNFI